MKQKKADIGHRFLLLMAVIRKRKTMEEIMENLKHVVSLYIEDSPHPSKNECLVEFTL